MPRGSEGSPYEQEKKELGFLINQGLQVFEEPSKTLLIERGARGKEHSVVFEGRRVLKYLTEVGLVPIVCDGKLDVRKAIPSEYLERLDLMNTYFLDDVVVEGILRNGNLVTSQLHIEGGDPTEKEISKTLNELGWRRIPANRPHVDPSKGFVTRLHPELIT